MLHGVLRIASLAKRWLLSTHQGAVEVEHLADYLDEFCFRFNRRRSRSRGLLFLRVLQLALRRWQLIARPKPKKIRPARWKPEATHPLDRPPSQAALAQYSLTREVGPDGPTNPGDSEPRTRPPGLNHARTSNSGPRPPTTTSSTMKDRGQATPGAG